MDTSVPPSDQDIIAKSLWPEVDKVWLDCFDSFSFITMNLTLWRLSLRASWSLKKMVCCPMLQKAEHRQFSLLQRPRYFYPLLKLRSPNTPTSSVGPLRPSDLLQLCSTTNSLLFKSWRHLAALELWHVAEIELLRSSTFPPLPPTILLPSSLFQLYGLNLFVGGIWKRCPYCFRTYDCAGVKNLHPPRLGQR